MAPFHSFLLSLVLFTSLVCAAPWVVTEYFEAVTITRENYYRTTTTTSIEEITPTVTALPEALSTITSVGTGYYYSDITVVQQLYPSGVGEPARYKYLYSDDDDDVRGTIYVVNITYSAPTGCSTQWTTTTAVPVTPPYQVSKHLPTTAMSTSVSVDNDKPFQPTTYTYNIVWVDPTQLPSASLSSYSRYSRPTSLYQGSGCSYYGSDNVDGSYRYGGNGGYHDDGDDWFMDSYYMGISPFALTLILLFGWIGLWLILGFVEAWVRFRRLMTGWQTHRGLPVCWAFTIMPFTLFFLCFCRRRGHRARTAAEAAILKEKWNDMSAWTRVRLFFAYGFRYQYPPMLGPAPARVNASKRPGKNPGEPLLYPQPVYQPPVPATGEVSRGPSADRSVGGTDPETGRVSPISPHPQTPAPVHHPAPEASGALPSGQPNGQDEIGRAQ